MVAEMQVLAKFRARCAYERTNPERKAKMNKSMVRQVYKEMICAFMRHPEVWHEWAMWELLTTEDASATAISVANTNKDTTQGTDKSSSQTSSEKNSNIANCIQVFELARKHIPDCALLTISQAEVLEAHGKNPKGAMKILNHFVSNIFPCAIGYVTLQKMVRRYDGMVASRKVFSRARRYLTENIGDKNDHENGETNNSSTNASSNPAPGQSASTNATSSLDNKPAMVKSRLDTISTQEKNVTHVKHSALTGTSAGNTTESSKKRENKQIVKRGVMTWHIYACHAMIEHRLNSLPLVAARIYELGLRKHHSFLATPAYVLQYADLLWELNEVENLRALLSRAIAACEENKEVTSSTCGTEKLWDAMLKLECTKGNNLERIRKIEASRRQALFDNFDLDFTADSVSQKSSDYAGISAQDAQNHKTLMESLIRMDGYETASLIGNGLGRMLDRFELMGAFGEGTVSSQYLLSSPPSFASITQSSSIHDAAATGGGGPSDLSFAKRVHHLYFQHHLMTTASSVAKSAGGGISSTNATTGITPNTLLDRSRAARERMQMQQQQNQHSAILAKMNAPEWLTPLISMLPPPPRFQRGGIPILQKPPPHLVEMALAFLKSTPLPERPQDEGNVQGWNGIGTMNGNKRKLNNYYSSDEEGDKCSSNSGYGNQFRMRQRARQLQSHEQNLAQKDVENSGEDIQ